jgi:hypothetical protein
MRFPPTTKEQTAQAKAIAELIAALPAPLPRISVADATRAFVELHSRYGQFANYLPSDVRRDYFKPHMDILAAFFAGAKINAPQTIENT